MSKGFIDAVFTIANYGADARVTTRCLLRKQGSNAKGASISGALVIKPRYEIKKFEIYFLKADILPMLLKSMKLKYIVEWILIKVFHKPISVYVFLKH